MNIKALLRNETIITLLAGTYIGIESYFLHLIAIYILPSFRFSEAILYVVSAISAYFVLDVFKRKRQLSRSKGIAVVTIILVVTVFAAVSIVATTLYQDKLRYEQSLSR